MDSVGRGGSISVCMRQCSDLGVMDEWQRYPSNSSSESSKSDIVVCVVVGAYNALLVGG